MFYTVLIFCMINSLFAISDIAINKQKTNNSILIKEKNSIFDAIKYKTDDEIMRDIKKLNNLNITDTQRRTLLHYAVIYGRYNLTKFLLKKGMKPYLQDAKGDTPLHIAVKNKNMAFVKLFLLSPGISLAIFIKNSKGLTPIDIALLQHDQTIISVFESFFQNSDFDTDFLINKNIQNKKYHIKKKKNSNIKNFTQIKNSNSKGNVKIEVKTLSKPSLLY